MATVFETFGDVISGLQGGGYGSGYARTARMGRVRMSREGEEGRMGASLVITLDKESLAMLMRRKQSYKALPNDIGHALWAVGQFILGAPVLVEGKLYVTEGPIKRAFRTESSPDGKPWEPLSYSQAVRRGSGEDAYRRQSEWSKKVPETEYHPILDHTSKLREAVTGETADMGHVAVTGKYGRLTLDPKHITTSGHLKDKFYVHQIGSSRGWGFVEIPERPFFPTDAHDLTGTERVQIGDILRYEILSTLEERRLNRAMNRRRR